MEGLRQLLALALVFGLLAALWWIKSRSGFGGLHLATPVRRPLSMVRLERLPLSPQHTLHLVRVADREFLIAAHASGCTLLHQFASGVRGEGGNA